MRPCERWPGEGSALSLGGATDRWSRGSAGIVLALDGDLHYADVHGACEGDSELLLSPLARTRGVECPGAWPDIAHVIRGSTRDVDGSGVGLYLTRVSYLCAEGWAHVHLVPGDPESIACAVLREALRRVGERPSVTALEVEMRANVDRRYRVELAYYERIAGAA